MRLKHFLIPVLCITTNLSTAQKESGKSSAMFHQQTTVVPDSQPYAPIGDVKWKFKTNGKIFSSPAVVKNIAFIGSEDGNIYAVNTATGKQVWKFTTGGAVHSSPAVYDNTVYVGSLDGHIYALNFTTGKLNWKSRTGGEKRIGDTSYWGMKPTGMYMEDLWDCFISSPIVDKTDDELTVYFGSSDGFVYAVNANDGSVKWKFKTNGSVHSSPALHNGILYIGGWDTYLYAINAKTGKEIWKFKTGDQMAMSGIQASPTVANGVVYFGARDAHLYALNADNGNLLWKYDAQGSWIVGSVVMKGDLLYVGTSDSYLLLAIDAKTGNEKYRLKANGYVFGTPAITGNTAYFGDFTGKMYALDLDSEGKRWNSFSSEGRKQHAASVLKNDTLNFAYTAKGDDLSSYPANKRVMDEIYKLGAIVSSPAVKEGVLYFGSADGYLYALRLRKKQVLGRN